METKKVADIATCAGEILMSNGAEAYRVEETIKKICDSYGMEGECVSTSTGIYISVTAPEGELVTRVKRIKQRNVDLYRVELVNSFSRELMKNPLPYEEAKKLLKGIYDAPNFSLRVRLMAACMTAFVYTLFFHGRIQDAVTALLISSVIYLMQEKISKVGSFQFLEFYLSGFMICVFSLIAAHFIPGISKDNVITGGIIVLLPGVALTNGIKDVLYGDYVSGFAKFGEAMLIILAMSIGIATALAIFMRWM